jgi:hypothetical protein
VTLSGTPEGGTFSGEGVSGNIFDPALTGDGEFTVSYSYIDTITECVVTASQAIRVNPLPFIALHDTSSCGNRPVLLDATIPNAGSYLWGPGGQTTASIQVDTVGRGLGEFTFSLTVTDGNNCTSTKDIKVTFFDCTGMPEWAGSSAIDLYPNPNTGRFSIQSNLIPAGTYTLKVYNSLNSIVYQENDVPVGAGFTRTLDLKHLANGIYLLRLENMKSGWSKQFIINR